jgi:hypothetical protein
MWSWILEGIGLLGAFVIGRKHWWGWLILLCNTFLWGVYSVTTHQYGFIVASIFYAFIYSKNSINWIRHKKETKDYVEEAEEKEQKDKQEILWYRG